MNRRVVIIAIVVAVLGLTVFLVLFGLNAPFLNPLKFEVSNLRLTYGSQMFSSFQPFIAFSVRNLHNSYLNTVGVAIDGANYGLSTLQIPPGQIQDESIPVNNLVLSSSRTYSIALTFTSADGKYQTFAGSYTTPQFKGQVTVTSISLIVGTYLYTFHVEVKNTGNLPITFAKYRFDNGFEQGLTPAYVLPGGTMVGGESLFSDLIVGSSYPVTILVEYSDGSTTTTNTSVIARQ